MPVRLGFSPAAMAGEGQETLGFAIVRPVRNHLDQPGVHPRSAGRESTPSGHRWNSARAPSERVPGHRPEEADTALPSAVRRRITPHRTGRLAYCLIVWRDPGRAACAAPVNPGAARRGSPRIAHPLARLRGQEVPGQAPAGRRYAPLTRRNPTSRAGQPVRRHPCRGSCGRQCAFQ